jgi:hypothetical protein
VTRTEITMATGVRYDVEGSPEEVEAAMVAAQRGSMMQLAWFTDAGDGSSVGVNPTHLVMLRAAGPAEGG